VNNAGIATFGPIASYTPEQWDTIIAINLTGVFNGIHASLDALKAAAPSSIINISSTAGLQGYSMLPGYNASKFGVRGLTKSVALDLGADGVRCNSVHAGRDHADDRGSRHLPRTRRAAPARPRRRDLEPRRLPRQRRVELLDRRRVHGRRRRARWDRHARPGLSAFADPGMALRVIASIL
jgi:NAD(P)-dependent dehydrogenase (short-subunit alcohol dehydrogenase family)